MSLDITPSGADVTATGSITASGQSVVLDLSRGGVSSTEFQLTGTFVGTVVFESSVDGGTTYNSRVYRSAGILNNLQTSTTTFPSEWRGNSAGMSHVRVRCTAYTSGTLSVSARGSTGTGAVFLNAAIPIGGQSTGNTYSAALSAGASFTGTYENLENVASIALNVSMNQAGTLTVQWSQDGSTLFVADAAITLTAGVAKYLTMKPSRAQYFRVILTNTSGSTASQVRMETVYRAVATDAPAVPLGSTGDISDTFLPPIGQSTLLGRSGTGFVQMTGDAAQGLDVDVTRSALPTGAATESTLSNRYSGGKTAVGATVTASGDTTIVTAGGAQVLTLYWISAINDPDEATSPLIKVKIGTTEVYRGYALAHWEKFVGAAGNNLIINLDGAASVAVTAHYTLV